MRRGLVNAIMAAALLLHYPTFAQETVDVKNVGGFTLKGDYFTDVNIPMSSLEQELFLEVVKLLDMSTSRLPDTVGYMPYISGSSLLNVKISTNNAILINLDKSLLSETGESNPEIEDFLNMLANGIEIAARKKLKEVTGLFFAIEGRSFESFMYPKDKALTPQGVIPSAVPGRAVVSAGHGFYFHFKFKDWRAQREPFYGVLEDDITPVLAETLSALLKDRSNAETFRVREATSSAAIHRPSGQPWWRLSARYYFVTFTC